MNSLGRLWTELGDYEKAIDYHQQSLEIAWETKDRDQERLALANIGNTAFCVGQYEQALNFYQQSLELS